MQLQRMNGAAVALTIVMALAMPAGATEEWPSVSDLLGGGIGQINPGITQCELIVCATAHAAVDVERIDWAPDVTIASCAYHGSSLVGPGHAVGAVQAPGFLLLQCSQTCVWDGDNENGCGNSDADGKRGALCAATVDMTTTASGIGGSATAREFASGASDPECANAALLAVVEAASPPDVTPPELENHLPGLKIPGMPPLPPWLVP